MTSIAKTKRRKRARKHHHPSRSRRCLVEQHRSIRNGAVSLTPFSFPCPFLQAIETGKSNRHLHQPHTCVTPPHTGRSHGGDCRQEQKERGEKKKGARNSGSSRSTRRQRKLLCARKLHTHTHTPSSSWVRVNLFLKERHRLDIVVERDAAASDGAKQAAKKIDTVFAAPRLRYRNDTRWLLPRLRLLPLGAHRLLHGGIGGA